jgi:hypothetical protein
MMKDNEYIFSSEWRKKRRKRQIHAYINNLEKKR